MGLHFGKEYNGEPTDCKMTVWEVTPAEKYTAVNISSSKKKGDAWVTDFNTRAFFMGEAKEPALNLVEKDRIIIKSAEVLVSYDKEKKQNRVSVFVYKFTMADGTMPQAKASSSIDENGFMDIPEGLDTDGLPFGWLDKRKWELGYKVLK